MPSCKIHHGDSLEYLKSLYAKSIDLIVTDPPYGVDFKQDIYDDSKESVESSIPDWFCEWSRVLKDGSYCYVFTGIRNINVWIDEGMKAGFEFKNILATRSFNNGCAVSNNFSFVFQPILVFAKGKGRKFNEVDFFPTSHEWFNDPRNKNPKPFTYQYPNFIPTDIAYGTETAGGLSHNTERHPNAKSVRLIKFLIEISTDQCDTVLDPFLGSGTTGESSLLAKRNFIGCELNEKWFNNSRRRLESIDPLFNEVSVI